MLDTVAELDRASRTLTVRLRGDLVIPTAPPLYGQLRAVAQRRGVATVVLDLAELGRLDTAGLAVISLVQRLMVRSGKALDFANVNAIHRATLELLPNGAQVRPVHEPSPTWLERVGTSILATGTSGAALGRLVTDVLREGAEIVMRKRKLPEGSLLHQAAVMGVDAVGIVALLGALLGTSLAFQSAVLLRRFGAGVYAADMVGLLMVRELGPILTAVILTGRTGAAIAAELGTMRVRSELDALDAMGVSSTRFLLLPRLAALTVVQPALTLMSMFAGIVGGLLVLLATMHTPATVYWQHVLERVDLQDFSLGLFKSVMFAWIIGFTGCHFGMRTRGDATGVGAATTRTVVVSIFMIVVVDAVVAMIGAAT